MPVIINIASLDGIRPSMKGLTTYGASKAGLIATTKHLALYVTGPVLIVDGGLLLTS
jgi:NAD(P)-dependent dehydrogenase (short-subunit alcohol dehydrogenase family)